LITREYRKISEQSLVFCEFNKLQRFEKSRVKKFISREPYGSLIHLRVWIYSAHRFGK